MGHSQEPLRKRLKMSSTTLGRSRDSHTPSELMLKSRFEGIFEKYARDFEDVSDVIDLRSGTMVIDNGHLRNMRHERDIGRDAPAEYTREASPPRPVFRETIAASDDEEEEELSSLASQAASPPRRQIAERVPTPEPVARPPDTSAIAQAISQSIPPSQTTPELSALLEQLGKSFASAIAPILQQALAPKEASSNTKSASQPPQDPIIRNSSSSSSSVRAPSPQPALSPREISNETWSPPHIPQESIPRTSETGPSDIACLQRRRSPSPELEEFPRPRRVRQFGVRPYARRSLWERQHSPPRLDVPEASGEDNTELVTVRRRSNPIRRVPNKWTATETNKLTRLCAGLDHIDFRQIKEHFPRKTVSSIEWRYTYVVKPQLTNSEGESAKASRKRPPAPALPTPPDSDETRKRKRNVHQSPVVFEEIDHEDDGASFEQTHEEIVTEQQGMLPAPIAQMSGLSSHINRSTPNSGTRRKSWAPSKISPLAFQESSYSVALNTQFSGPLNPQRVEQDVRFKDPIVLKPKKRTGQAPNSTDDTVGVPWNGKVQSMPYSLIAVQGCEIQEYSPPAGSPPQKRQKNIGPWKRMGRPPRGKSAQTESGFANANTTEDQQDQTMGGPLKDHNLQAEGTPVSYPKENDIQLPQGLREQISTAEVHNTSKSSNLCATISNITSGGDAENRSHEPNSSVSSMALNNIVSDVSKNRQSTLLAPQSVAPRTPTIVTNMRESTGNSMSPNITKPAFTGMTSRFLATPKQGKLWQLDEVDI